MDTAVLEAIAGLLDLEGFDVVETTSDRVKKSRLLTMVATATVASCPHCGELTADRHACHDRKVRDLSWAGWQTELNIKLFQFKCGPCNKYFTPLYPGLSADGAHATERFLERLAELASAGDVSSAARFLGIPKKTAEEWYYDHLKRKEKEPVKNLQPIRALGIDELSLKKDTGSSSVS